MPLKLTWRVGSVQTGRYRSFYLRAWPSATFNDQLVASIHCDEEYRPSAARTGQHYPLSVFFYDYSAGTVDRKMRKLVATFTTLDVAKQAIQSYFERHPEMLPKEESREQSTSG